jgi:hypothetical protein
MTDKIFLVSILKPGYGKFKIIKILRYASSYAPPTPMASEGHGKATAGKQNDTAWNLSFVICLPANSVIPSEMRNLWDSSSLGSSE